MPKLRVKRKAYTAIRDGKKVKVSKSKSFLIKDRGAKGRTPESEKFFEPKVHTGWQADMPAEERRRKVLRAHKSDALAAARSMQALSNVQHRINPDTAQKAKSDADYFFALNRKKK